MNVKLCSVLLPLLCLALACPNVSAQTATVDFESLTVGDEFGGNPGLGNVQSDLIFTEDGVGVHVDDFTLGLFTGFNSVRIADESGNNVAFVSNILLDFDVSGLGGPVTEATFDFADFGGDENLVVNGAKVELANFMSAPATLGGVAVSVTTLPIGSVRGTVTLNGPINSLGIGGQELQIDNVRFRYNAVPEPSSGATLMLLIGAAAMRRRRG